MDPSVSYDIVQFRALSKEFKSLEPLVVMGKEYLDVIDQVDANKELIDDPHIDAELRDMAYEEQNQLRERLANFENELKILLLPRDPNDAKNCIIEVRAGTGGDEAGIFVGDLFRMYQRFAERTGFVLEVIDMNESERGGFKEIVFSLEGESVFGRMKYESGVHRVQRVPETEANGRIHTSAATVAVLPEAEEIDIDIREQDLRIDIFRSGGKGGQNVNKVETKIELYFDVLNSNLFKDEEKEKIFVKLKNRIDKNGILRIISQSERTQFLNKTKAVSKFYKLIEKALEKEKIRKKVKVSKAEKEKRLTGKKKLSVKKYSRKINLKDLES